MNDYIRSGRFIQDDLLVRADAMARKLPSLFHQYGRIYPLLFTWPGEAVTLSNGKKYDGICVLELQDVPQDEWMTSLRRAVEHSKAYGMLFIEQKKDSVVAIFESPQGTRAWTLAIRRHGDLVVLESPEVTTDFESIGILWSPARATA